MCTAVIAAVVALGLSGGVRAPNVERQAHALETRLMAPCCFSQQLSVHHSAAADDARREIRRRLADGEGEDEIVGAYVGRYGNRILAVPPATGFARLLYLTPPIMLVASAALLLLAVRRFTRPAAERHTGGERERGAEVDPWYEAQIGEQLRNLD